MKISLITGIMIRPFSFFDQHLDPPFFNFPPIDSNACLDHISWIHGPNTLGSTREDQISLFKSHHLGDTAQQTRDPEEHEIGGVLLAHFPIHGQMELGRMRIWYLYLRDEIAG